MTVQTFYTPEEDQIVITRKQMVGGIVDYAKAMSNEGFHGTGDARFVATIPAVVIEHYCNTHGISFHEWTSNPEVRKRFLNDPEYSDLRIWKGTV